MSAPQQPINRSRFHPIPIRRFRGLNEDLNPEAVGDDELIVALNTYRRGETKGTRPGLERDTTDYTAAQSGAINGIVDYRRSNGATRKLVIVSNAKIKAGDGGGTPTGADITGAVVVTAGTNHRWTFAQHNATLYGAGGTSIDSFWKWTGSGNAAAVAILDLSAAALYPTYVFQKWNRLWTAGFRDAAGAIATDLSSNPMLVRYSALSDGDVWPLGNTVGGTGIGGLSAYGNEYVTGFGEYTDNTGDWLLILTNQRIYSVRQLGDDIVPFSISGSIATGCVHQNAFVSLGLDSGDAVYLSRHGIHSLRQSQQFGAREDAFLSWKIRQTFNSLSFSSLQRSVGAYWQEEGIVVFAVPTGSDANPTLMLSLDIKGKEQLTAANAEWDLWYMAGASTNAKTPTALHSGHGTSNESYIYLGTAAGEVTRFTTSTNTDLGLGYAVRMRTKHQDYGAPSDVKGLGDVMVTIQPGGDYSPTFRPIFDYGHVVGAPQTISMAYSQDVWGSGIWGQSYWGVVNATMRDRLYGIGGGRTIAYEFSHTGADEPFWIVSVTPEVRVHGRDQGVE